LSGWTETDPGLFIDVNASGIYEFMQVRALWLDVSLFITEVAVE
jgi:hypothetical protein